MLKALGYLLVAGVLVGGVVYQARQTPAVGWFFLKDATPEENSFAWPPRLDEEYPDVELVDQTGRLTRLSEFRGKIILVELIGIPCGACQAYAGAHRVGAFDGGKVQSNLDSIEIYANRYGGVNMNDRRVVFVQILLFNSAMQAPTAEDARAWAEHFGMDREKNRIVLAGTPALASRQSYDLIPGFHLIDRQFILRRDSAGHQPKHDLYTDLLPAMGKMLSGNKKRK